MEFHPEGMQEKGLEIPDAFRKRYDLDYKIDVKTLFDWFVGI